MPQSQSPHRNREHEKRTIRSNGHTSYQRQRPKYDDRDRSRSRSRQDRRPSSHSQSPRASKRRRYSSSPDRRSPIHRSKSSDQRHSQSGQPDLKDSRSHHYRDSKSHNTTYSRHDRSHYRDSYNDGRSSRPSRRSSRSQSPRRHRNRDSRPSPTPRQITDESPHTTRKASRPLPSQADAYTNVTTVTQRSTNGTSPAPERQKANYKASGLLAREANTVQAASTTFRIDPHTGRRTAVTTEAIILKYHEPPEARLPPSRDEWKIFVFKDADPASQEGTTDEARNVLETLDIYTRTCWLLGREEQVVDHHLAHPSISKQHAVLQFRHTEKQASSRTKAGEMADPLLLEANAQGGVKSTARVRLYLLDLESANGTFLNGERVPEGRYIEVKSGDLITFASSTREYVVLLPPR